MWVRVGLAASRASDVGYVNNFEVGRASLFMIAASKVEDFHHALHEVGLNAKGQPTPRKHTFRIHGK